MPIYCKLKAQSAANPPIDALPGNISPTVCKTGQLVGYTSYGIYSFPYIRIDIIRRFFYNHNHRMKSVWMTEDAQLLVVIRASVSFRSVTAKKVVLLAEFKMAQ